MLKPCSDVGSAPPPQGHPGAQDWDNALSKARFEFRWCAAPPGRHP